MRQIIYNGLKTPDGTIIVSRDMHDFVRHVDKNGKTYFIDGGFQYIRSSCNGDEEYITYYDDAPHELQRKVITWGTLGKNGNEEYKLIPISEMEDKHLRAVIEKCNPIPTIKKCIINELKLRKLYEDCI